MIVTKKTKTINMRKTINMKKMINMINMINRKNMINMINTIKMKNPIVIKSKIVMINLTQINTTNSQFVEDKDKDKNSLIQMIKNNIEKDQEVDKLDKLDKKKDKVEIKPEMIEMIGEEIDLMHRNFLLYLENLGLIVHPKVTKAICLMILKKWINSIG